MMMAWLGLVSTRPWAGAATQHLRPTRQAARTQHSTSGQWLVFAGFLAVWVLLALVALPVLAAALLAGGLLAVLILWFPHSCVSVSKVVRKNGHAHRLGPPRRLGEPDSALHRCWRIPSEPRTLQTRPWR